MPDSDKSREEAREGLREEASGEEIQAVPPATTPPASQAEPQAPKPVITVNDAAEIAKLKRQLAEKELQIMRTAVAAERLEGQLREAKKDKNTARQELTAALASARVQKETPGKGQREPMPRPGALPADEIEKLKAEWRLSQKGVEREHNERRLELMRIKSQWHQTQQQLEQENRARRSEAALASAKIAVLEREVVDARGVVASSGATDARDRSSRFRLSAAAGVAAVVMAGFVVWLQSGHAGASAAVSPNGADPVSPAPVITSTEKTKVSAPDRIDTSTLNIPLSSAASPQSRAPVTSQFGSQQGFGAGLSRLNNALSGFTGNPEQVLKAVRARAAKANHPVCAFQWNNGQPALLYGADGGHLTLADTLSQCADAVERFH